MTKLAVETELSSDESDHPIVDPDPPARERYLRIVRQLDQRVLSECVELGLPERQQLMQKLNGHPVRCQATESICESADGGRQLDGGKEPQRVELHVVEVEPDREPLHPDKSWVERRAIPTSF